MTTGMDEQSFRMYEARRSLYQLINDDLDETVGAEPWPGANKVGETDVADYCEAMKSRPKSRIRRSEGGGVFGGGRHHR